MDKFNIESLYKRLLPRLEVLEEERLALLGKLKKLKNISIGIGIILLIAGLAIIGGFLGIIVASALGITFYTILYHKMIEVYRKNYKIRVFQELVNELGDHYKYTVDGTLEDNVLKESGIFHEFTKSKYEDLIEGTFDTYLFKMAETNLWYEKQKFEDNKHGPRDAGGAYSYIFKGLFMVGKIPLSFPTAIWILAKNHPQVHPKSRVMDSWEKVRVDNKAFRMEYDVYAENKEIAAQILQDSILETIIKTKNSVVDNNMRLELSFQQNMVYLSISTIKELFEPPIKTSVTDFNDFIANFKYLANITSLLQRLTLVKT
jgi:hypothetical protein